MLQNNNEKQVLKVKKTVKRVYVPMPTPSHREKQLKKRHSIFVKASKTTSKNNMVDL
ncbi:hypothetical protein [Parageobacillus thermoglucosidasius]|uniref:hypothetical protein n=1 Tax=Parageobacillus thermoglucosidasius TaxID=1426 RepID=UPI00241FBEF8|nr:hypothetical protein [Parageobacillus thermoglucosidasius]